MHSLMPTIRKRKGRGFMASSTFSVLGFTIPVYSFALVVGIVISIGVAVRRGVARPAVLVDLALGGTAGAVIVGRAGHVLLHWTYFGDHTSEALRPAAGGLDWHGALLGALIGLAVVARWRKLIFRVLLDALAPALPLMVFAGWLGCWGAACGYGAEVDTLAHYPAFAAAETRDVYGIAAPRYNTQIFGMALAAALLLSWLMNRRGWLAGRRFWVLLALLSAGMFVIGLFRGDEVPIVAGLRADQVMDIALLLWGSTLTLYNRRQAV